MTDGIKLSFETLKADEAGRRLQSASGRYEVAAKVVSTEEGDQFLSLRVWIGSEDSSGGDGWSEPSAWSHTVYDAGHNLVAYGFGARERDSWAMVERILGKKLGVAVAHGPGISPKRWREHFSWEPGDVDILSRDEVAEILGDEARIGKPSAQNLQEPHDAAVFRDDDAGYLQWLGEHPSGFVLNTYRNPSPDYLKLHRPTCQWISGTPAHGERWTVDPIKVCADTPDPLHVWVAEHAPGGKPDLCGHCCA